MVEKRAASVRRLLGVALGVLALLSASASVSLVLVSTWLHRTSHTIGDAIERYEESEDSQRDLLLHDRAETQLIRTNLANDALLRLERLALTAPSDRERKAAARALAAMRAHFEAPEPEPGEHDDRAEEALADLARIQRGLLATHRHEATRIDALSDAVGLATGAIILFGTIILVLVLQRRIVQPLVRFTDGVRAFANGDADVRLDEDGPREIGAMARAFNAMTAKLVEQRAAHRTYLAGVAHDLRNPVQVLRTAVALDPNARRDPDQAERILGVVQRQLGQLERLIEDLLDTENLQAGRLSLDRAEHDLRDIARSVERLFAKASPSHEIEVDLPEAPVVALCDGARIEQVLTNLVSNAIKYSPHGGKVSIAVRAIDAGAEVEVRDQGIGMTAEQIETVFRPFSRGADVRESIPGHGLGLFVAARIVQAHGGAIDVESRPGEGSRFRIALPPDAH